MTESDTSAPPDPFRFVDAQAEVEANPYVPKATWVPPGAFEPAEPKADPGDSSDEDAVEGLAGGSVQLANAPQMDDDEVNAFLPMLQEYLSRMSSRNESLLIAVDRPSLPVATLTPPRAGILKAAATQNFVFAPLEDPEWVYDLYYRDTRPEGVPLSLGAGDGVGAL